MKKGTLSKGTLFDNYLLHVVKMAQSILAFGLHKQKLDAAMVTIKRILF